MTGEKRWNQEMKGSGKGLAVATCPDCGKLRYKSRADAKRRARQIGQNLRVYRCGDFWHQTSQSSGSTTAYRDHFNGPNQN